MRFDPLHRPYPSIRYPIYAKNGMVAASHPMASAAGLELLRRGGNAVDAAVAAAAALTVVEPTSNGIGGDAFALVWIEKDQKLYGLNASGISPGGISIEKVRALGHERMPTLGWTPVMVPGAPKGWAALSKRFGNRPLTSALSPAIGYAADGYAVTPVLSQMWRRSYEAYAAKRDMPELNEWFRVFAPEGRAPLAGEIVRLPDHARTLTAIAETDADAFYSGALAERIDRESRKYSGFLRAEDLAAYDVQWVEPASVRYRGYDICEIPPNGQGIVALMALNILNQFDAAQREDGENVHRQWEAMKLAFADGLTHITDPKAMRVDYRELLAGEYGARQAIRIGARATPHAAMEPPKSGTVYLCAADCEGNMVSYIQSNYLGFGSGVVVADTGISLQNRGRDFSLDAAHANALAPRKKTYHTIIPGFLMKDGRAVGPFGVMGGYMQPQGHVQVAMNLIDCGLNPQQALDAPRWQWTHGNHFLVEEPFDREVVEALRGRGHEVTVERDPTSFGRGQVIIRLDSGAYAGATECRTDGSIACY